MTIAAGIVRDVFMGAVSALRHMPAKRRRTATLDCAHHFELGQADVSCVLRSPNSTMGAENIRNLQ